MRFKTQRKNRSSKTTTPSPVKPSVQNINTTENATPGIRLNKVIADSGYCSRRQADILIANAQVTVNGLVISTLGQLVNPAIDKIAVDGQPLPKFGLQYILLNKPVGYLCSKAPQKTQRSLYQLLPSEMHHLDTAGRLDYMSSGAIILSNDGPFIHQITHPKFDVHKTYHVTVSKPLSEDKKKQLSNGVFFKKEQVWAKLHQIKPVTPKGPQRQKPDTFIYSVTLHTGYNRQIRRAFDKIGNPVLRIHRVAVGSIHLGNLKGGTFRPLTASECQQLRP
ncbi:MAG: pseudouridine synthase [Cyanobacteria bacterium P01_H01_bin.74]